MCLIGLAASFRIEKKLFPQAVLCKDGRTPFHSACWIPQKLNPAASVGVELAAKTEQCLIWTECACAEYPEAEGKVEPDQFFFHCDIMNFCFPVAGGYCYSPIQR